jgi:fatty acid desaturase
MAKTRYLPAKELRKLAKINPWKSLGSIAFTWLCIFGAVALYCARPNVLTFAIGWLVISGRHLALAVLMHDGAHRLILRNRVWNDRIASWFTARPIMLDVELYRRVHLQHHKATWTANDPDLGLATPFPVTKNSLFRKILRDLTGIAGLRRYLFLIRLSAGLNPMGKGLDGSSLGKALRTFAKNQAAFLLINAVFFAACALARHPEAYFLLWVLPSLTGYSLVLRLRSIAEHAVISDPNDELRQTRTTLAPFWLRFFIAPHNVNYHLEHHLFMFVPHYNLAKAHRLLAAEGVLERAEIAPSYWDVLRRASSAA